MTHPCNLHNLNAPTAAHFFTFQPIIRAFALKTPPPNPTRAPINTAPTAGKRTVDATSAKVEAFKRRREHAPNAVAHLGPSVSVKREHPVPTEIQKVAAAVTRGRRDKRAAVSETGTEGRRGRREIGEH